MDETSVSLWAPIKRKTWTNNTIHMPYQSKRGRNTTVIGAVGGRGDEVFWVSSVVRRTCKEHVRQFLEKLINTVPWPLKNIIVVADNHSSHHSYYV